MVGCVVEVLGSPQHLLLSSFDGTRHGRFGHWMMEVVVAAVAVVVVVP